MIWKLVLCSIFINVKVLFSINVHFLGKVYFVPIDTDSINLISVKATPFEYTKFKQNLDIKKVDFTCLAKITDSLKKNDWYKLMFYQTFIRKLYCKKSITQQFFLLAYILEKEGYSMIIFVSQKKKEMILGGAVNCKRKKELDSYIIRSGNCYVSLTSNSKASNYTNFIINKKGREFDLDSGLFQDSTENKYRKNIVFYHNRRKYEVGYNVDIGLLIFLKDYPINTIKRACGIGFSLSMKLELYPQLKFFMANFDKLEQVNFLLSFTRQINKFHIEDEKHYGYERVNFCDETLYFDTVDCEDKAIVLYTLLNELTNYKSMVVQYESQRHAFVMIEHKIDGVNFMRFKGREYIYLEPSDLNNTMKIGEYLDKSWDFKKFEVLIYN